MEGGEEEKYMDSAFLRVEEMAKILKLKRSTAYELVRRGVIPSVRLGRAIRIRRDVVEGLGKETKN